MRHRQATVAKDERGAVIATVPLGPKGEFHCTLDLDSWRQLLESGYSDKLNYIVGPNSKRYVIVRDPKAGNRNVMVARIIAGATENQRVLFINGNTCDLRRENLRVIDNKR